MVIIAAVPVGCVLVVGLLLYLAARFVITEHPLPRWLSDAYALRTALFNYRHEYGRWPIPPQWEGSSHFTSNKVGNAWERVFIAKGGDNALVFDLLRHDNVDDTNANPRGILFFDESSIQTVLNGKCMTYKDARGGGGHLPFPLAYITRKGTTRCYNVTINLDQDFAEVECETSDQ